MKKILTWCACLGCGMLAVFEAKLQELVGAGAGKEPAVEKNVDDVR